MYCNKCGAPLPDDTRFCNKCGAQTPAAPPPAAGQPATAAPRKSGASYWFYWCFFAVLFGLTLALAAAWYVRIHKLYPELYPAPVPAPSDAREDNDPPKPDSDVTPTPTDTTPPEAGLEPRVVLEKYLAAYTGNDLPEAARYLAGKAAQEFDLKDTKSDLRFGKYTIEEPLAINDTLEFRVTLQWGFADAELKDTVDRYTLSKVDGEWRITTRPQFP